MKHLVSFLIFFLTIYYVHADEGMWMLTDIQKSPIHAMHKLGCTLSADDIYSADHISIKDAVIVFGGGCTGVVVSKQGLIFTNHHCGHGSIQQLSTVEHNYLKDGFTAKALEDELPVPGLTVKFLVSITDVTDRVSSVLPDSLSFSEREHKQDSIIAVIKEEFGEDNDYLIQVKSFYSDNAFYVFVLEEFKDIRLAYAPPTSIGKFGGDTDNWMWSRHTGDFAVFRIYADSLGKPAEYAESNIPYKPKKIIPISMDGYQAHDFAMILGNPGTTSRYLSSYGIYNRVHAINQARIDVRGEKQAVWQSFMKADEAINIAYAGKYAISSNYWKNSIGMNRAVQKKKIIERKEALEKEVLAKLNSSAVFASRYGDILPALKRNYETIFPTQRASLYLSEALQFALELPSIAHQLKNLILADTHQDSLICEAKTIYKDYHAAVDEATMAAMLRTYKLHVDGKYLPTIYQQIDKKFKGDYAAFVRHLYKKSAFADYQTFSRNLKRGKLNLDKDPALLFYEAIGNQMNAMMSQEHLSAIDSLQHLNRMYEAALQDLEIIDKNAVYPDANFTMRMTYGTISGYQPGDAVSYNYYTTAVGILEKEIPDDREFHVPAELKELLLQRNYGNYADKESGELFVNFLCNTDITGGNSGSPVFNAQGALLGLAFDGNWEAMSGDIIFEPTVQRTIAVDVRYMLFIMDKIGGAERLLNEVSSLKVLK